MRKRIRTMPEYENVGEFVLKECAWLHRNDKWFCYKFSGAFGFSFIATMYAKRRVSIVNDHLTCKKGR